MKDDGSNLVHLFALKLFRESESSPPLVRADFISRSYESVICMLTQ